MPNPRNILLSGNEEGLELFKYVHLSLRWEDIEFHGLSWHQSPEL